jgi:actin-like ATPase involved in cell morphogenesis
MSADARQAYLIEEPMATAIEAFEAIRRANQNSRTSRRS